MEHFLYHLVKRNKALPNIDNVRNQLGSTDEVETKVLTQGGTSDFQALLSALKQRDMYIEAPTSTTLCSSYFDTEDQTLYKDAKGLRVRYKKDKQTGETLRPDISTKGMGERFGHGTVRTELEANMDELQLDLNALYKEYRKDASSISYLDNLTNLFNKNAHALKEMLSIECERQHFKVAVFVTENEEVIPFLRYDETQHGDAKRVVFEFALDHSKFMFFTNESDNVIVLSEDYEIEMELKAVECHYDPNPMASCEDISAADVLLAQNFIVEIIKDALDEENLDWSALSKQERGFQALEDYTDQHGSLPLPKKPTSFGKPLTVRKLQP
jgi:hypothetical protein